MFNRIWIVIQLGSRNNVGEYRNHGSGETGKIMTNSRKYGQICKYMKVMIIICQTWIIECLKKLKIPALHHKSNVELELIL